MRLKPTLLATLLALTLIAGGSEGLLRTFIPPDKWPAPTTGLPPDELVPKITLLDAYVAEHGSVECIFVGSSLVHRGVDPATFEMAYQRESGTSLSCFNFGLQGLVATEVDILSQWLIQRYQPLVLIYGTTLRDYAERQSHFDTFVLETLHMRDLFGLRAVNSRPLLQTLSYRYLMWGVYHYRAEKAIPDEFAPRSDGFGPFPAIEPSSQAMRLPPRFVSLLAGYEAMSPATRNGLEQLTVLQSPSTRIIVVEMPLPGEFFTGSPQAQAGYDTFLHELETVTGQADVLLVEAEHTSFANSSLWHDYHHLNEQGAALFSQWLGAELPQYDN